MIEKLKALEAAADTGTWYSVDGDIQTTRGYEIANGMRAHAEPNMALIAALRNLGPELIALWEAVREDILDENGVPCDCNRPVCAAYQALESKAKEVLCP